jgi:hypothetical protein
MISISVGIGVSYGNGETVISGSLLIETGFFLLMEDGSKILL